MPQINGNGTIYHSKSKNLWIAEYYITDNGVKKKKSLSGKTKKEVSEKLTKVMYEYHNSKFIKKSGIKLINLLKQNREDKFNANIISESHYSRLEFVIKEIESNEIGKMNIDRISSRDLQNYFNSLTDRYTDSTIKKVWECIKQGFELAVEENYILENPFKKVIKPKSNKETKVLEALSLEDENKLASYLLQSNLNEEKYKVVILTQLYTGMRIGEVLALSSDDIDFEKNIIKVRKTVTVDKDGYLMIKSGTKTYSGKRDIPISPFLINPLMEQIESSKNNRNQLLFTYENRLIKASTVNTVLKRICKQLKLSRIISNHTLRHTFGTRCIESGMSPKVVQILMGHKDISVTLNTYTSVLNQFKTEEFNKVAQYYLTRNLNSLPDAENNNLIISDVSEAYIGAFDVYLPYKFTDTQVINIFGGVDNMQKEIILSLKKIYEWKNNQ